MNTETADLKTKVEQHDRHLRDRPARHLIWAGAAGLVASSVLIAACITAATQDPSMVYIRESTNPVLLTAGLLSGCAVLTGLILRHARAEVAQLSQDLTSKIETNQLALVRALARIATLVQQVAATQVKLDERLTSVDALHERLDKLAELMHLAVGQVARSAYAAAVQDLRAEFAAERKAAARELEETLKRVFAQGYVAGVRERHNGEGGKVVQLPQAAP